MVHPLIPQIEALAAPVAFSLGLEVVHIVFHTNQFPPVLRIDIRPVLDSESTSHAHCEAFSRAFETYLDSHELITNHYVLEVSSPGVERFLVTEQDFTVFKGFPVLVTTDPPHRGQKQWAGNLLQRDAATMTLSLKGRRMVIPTTAVQSVELVDLPES